MAAFTSKAAGNWSASGQTTWNEVGVPGNGDTTTITHAITVDTNTTVGHSPGAGDATAAILLNGTGAILTIATGVTLTVRGDLKKAANTARVVLQAGSHFRFDATQAGTPSTARYVTASTADSLTGVTFDCQGTSGSHCTITSDVTGGAAKGRISDGGKANGGVVTATYTDFSYLGDSGNSGLKAWPYSGAITFSLTDCTFDNCGMIETPGGVNNCSIVLTRVIVTNTAHATISAKLTTAHPTTGTRSITFCSFDKQVQLYDPTGMTITDNYFGGNVDTTPGVWTSFRRNFLKTATTYLPYRADILDSYVLTTIANGRGFGVVAGTFSSLTFTIDGCLFDSSYASQGAGDLIFPGQGTDIVTIAQNCIVLPNAGGFSPGELLNPYGWAAGTGGTVQMLHNTVCTTGTSETGICVWGEAGAGKAGTYTAIKSNIAWTPAGKSAGAKVERYTGGVQDACAAADADYNAGYGLTTGESGKGYDSWDATAPFTGSPGAHDVDGQDPQFVDSTRNLATWGAMKGTDGSLAAALALIAANPALIYNASDSTALIQWVRHGFAPTNAAYNTTAHDGGTIGAVPFFKVASGTGSLSLTAGFTDAGAKATSGTGALSVVSALTEAGAKKGIGAGSLSLASAFTATGSGTHPSAGSPDFIYSGDGHRTHAARGIVRV